MTVGPHTRIGTTPRSESPPPRRAFPARFEHRPFGSLDIDPEQVEVLNFGYIVEPACFKWNALDHFIVRLESPKQPQRPWIWFEQTRHPRRATDLQRARATVAHCVWPIQLVRATS